jgi:hypothetical protein
VRASARINAPMPKHVLALFALPLCLSLAACDKKDEKAEDKKSDDKKADEVKADEAKPEEAKPEAPAEPEKPAIVMVEHDLSSADPEWAGWVAQGPEGAKVMADGVKGARIAAGKIDWDLAWAPKKTDLAELKKNLEKGAENSKGEMKLTFTTDTPEALEWTSEGYGATNYNFVIHMQVEDREISCKNNYMIGIPSKELLEQHKEACKSLKKKAAE